MDRDAVLRECRDAVLAEMLPVLEGEYGVPEAKARVAGAGFDMADVEREWNALAREIVAAARGEAAHGNG